MRLSQVSHGVLVGSVRVAYCTVLLGSVVLGCSSFLWFTAGFGSPLAGLAAYVGFSSVSPRGLWRSLWCRLSLPHGQNLWDSHLPLWCPCLVQTWHSLWRFTISQQICRSLLFNSGHEASSCDPEQHKQFCVLPGGLLCPSPVPGLLTVSFASKSVTRNEVRRGFGGS